MSGTFFPAFLAMICSNLIFTKALGMSTLAISAKSKTDFIGIGLTITIFTTIGSALTYCADRWILHGSLPFLPLVYVILLAVLYAGLLLLLQIIGKPTFLRFRKYVHLSAFNCAVLGTLLLNSMQGGSFLAYLSFGFQSGLGFLAASCILKAIYPRLISERVPASVRGYPAILLYIGILTMAVYGMNK